MKIFPVFLGVIFLFLLSLQGTRFYIRYAEAHRILDIPNRRSSHETPTPRGGGIVFVALFLAVSALFLVLFPERRDTWLAILGGGSAVALVGWIDDRSGLGAGTRLLVHFGAVAWALYWLGGFPSLYLGSGYLLHLGYWGIPLALVGGVWLVNLYNFMDGIDGLAAGEAVFVCVAAGILGWRNEDLFLAASLFVLATLVSGFLVLNWSPAKVFMGDVGSGFLGYAFAVFAFSGEKTGSVPALVFGLLLSVFVVDSTMTLFRRISHRERLSEAHRSHVFQLAVKRGFSHQQVSGTFLILGAALSSLLIFCIQGNSSPLGVVFLFSYAGLGFLWLALNKNWSFLLMAQNPKGRKAQ